MKLLEVSNLKKYFPVRTGVFSKISGWVRAVDGVSFTMEKGQTLGLVGESGCGKTTIGKTILRLIKPTSGDVVFSGAHIEQMDEKGLRPLRRRMQIIFQDPISSLNPRMTAGGLIGEPLRVHSLARGRDLEKRVADLLDKVGLQPSAINRYPHEFSGGQRQRIGIARAIALEPDLLVCDEPVSALDVSIQAQIINLLERLQGDLQLAYLFISHDLRVVEHISERVAVMYMGTIVEEAARDQMYKNPLHPYTRALFSAVPEIGRGKTKEKLRGEVGSGFNQIRGCRFRPRCGIADEKCSESKPDLVEAEPGHKVACWHV